MNGTYDFVAVGLGPFNLGLACLAAPIEELNGLVVEAKPEFDWHPGMLLEGTTLQTPFLADLVTLADPTSSFSFLNYLKACGRIYSFYMRESFFPLRHEYVDYCRWAAAQLPSIRFGQTVSRVEYDADERVYLVQADRSTGADRVIYRARRLVLGTGTPPHLPDPCRSLDPPPVHSSRYLEHRSALRAQARIVLVGSGQSAAEIYFGSVDYLRYAPETARAVRLHWVAARRDRASFSCGRDLDYDRLMDAELGPATRDQFAAVLAGHHLDPSDYLLIPVHPWQWRNRLSVTFAGDLARRELVWLGAGEDEYQPQQSIRTFFNRSAPAKHYVKTALSVLNMGFLRGLSAAYMAGTPAINDWVADLIAGDPLLQQSGFAILRERAAVGYRHAQFHAATSKGSPYRKLLAALWRESPVPMLGSGERLVTMASLLHVDRAGASLASALIAESGMAPAAWLRRYLDAYLLPVLHCFYAHDLVFMPHGENVILVLDEHGVPKRALFKDIAEEIGVMNADVVLPSEVERVRAVPPESMRTLSVLVDVFDCFFRFLSAILHTDSTLHQDSFWTTVAACVTAYQDSMPELADRFRRDNLFAARFDRSCLNRLQLRDNQQMVDLDDPDPAGGLQFAGTLDNPIAGKEFG